jgi:hypothetical protein
VPGHCRAAGAEDNRRIGPYVPQSTCQCHTGHMRHIKVREDDVKALGIFRILTCSKPPQDQSGAYSFAFAHSIRRTIQYCTYKAGMLCAICARVVVVLQPFESQAYELICIMRLTHSMATWLSGSFSPEMVAQPCFST